MPSIHELWPEKWLKPQHLQGKRPVVHIERATVERLFNPRTRREEPKLVLEFYGKEKRLVCNKTQATALAQITQTDDYTDWAGHSVVLSAGTAPNGSPTILISPLPDRAPTVHAPDPAADAESDEAADDEAADEEYTETDPVTAGDFTE